MTFFISRCIIFSILSFLAYNYINMITLAKLQSFLDGFLNYDKNLDLTIIDPYMANGLQVKGSQEIKKIGIGVSASMELFQMTVEKKCQALVVHHALNLPSRQCYDEIFQNRLTYLIKHNISLFGYHFLLDSHPEIGHNIKIVKLLGGKSIKPFLFHKQPWGYLSQIEPISLNNLLKKVEPYFSDQMKIYRFGNHTVKTVAALSGRGLPYASDLQYLITNKVDLYITGEVSEWIRELFREAKINFIAGGHYHTERFGLLALEKILCQQLAVETEFLELENEV